MAKNKTKRDPTPKQKKVIRLMFENVRSEGITKTKGELVKGAGYTDAMSKNPKKVFDTKAVKDATEDIVEMMELERLEALREAKKKRKKASYRDLMHGSDIMTKNSRLLSGKSTENKDVNISNVLDELED